MARKKKEPNRVDELLEDCHSPEDILGESGLMKQIKKRLVERALAGEPNHHLKSGAADGRGLIQGVRFVQLKQALCLGTAGKIKT